MTIRELLAEESPTLRRRLASLFSGLPDETPASPLSCAAGEVVVRQDAPCLVRLLHSRTLIKLQKRESVESQFLQLTLSTRQRNVTTLT